MRDKLKSLLPDLLTGAASLLDLRGQLLPSPSLFSSCADPAQDQANLAGDWQRVAGDFGQAFERIKPQ
jgi:hypothetical protein